MRGDCDLAVSFRRVNFINEECDNPFENADEEGMAAAGMDLRFAFGFDGICPVVPLQDFEWHKVEVEAFCEFGGAWVLDEIDGALACFGDVGCWKPFSVKAG